MPQKTHKKYGSTGFLILNLKIEFNFFNLKIFGKKIGKKEKNYEKKVSIKKGLTRFI